MHFARASYGIDNKTLHALNYKQANKYTGEDNKTVLHFIARGHL